jgi:hypothetical protein
MWVRFIHMWGLLWISDTICNIWLFLSIVDVSTNFFGNFLEGHFTPLKSATSQTRLEYLGPAQHYVRPKANFKGNPLSLKK